ncbi:MAG: phosphoenolpyruvate--protein phosphotransferase [Actinobacteria bacterium]|nr:phosphoenolpyruvate--protein phosphotransferase [Actinomycetota bacterium]
MRVLQGKGVSPGVNIGKPVNIERSLDFSIPAKISLDEGLKKLTSRYQSIVEKYNKLSREVEAEVIEAYILILNDPELISSLSDLSNSQLEEIYNIFLEQSEVFKQMDDEYFRQRSEDIEAIGKELIFTIQDISLEIDMETQQIIFANELTPNETSSMNLNQVMGFVVKEGGPTSHAVIVAKNYGIPCILNISVKDFDIENTKEVIINGTTGELTINPDKSSLKVVEDYQQTIISYEENYNKESLEKLGIELRANIGSTDEIKNFKDPLIKSVGLFRSEFLYIEETQEPKLSDLVKANNLLNDKFEKTIVYRTLDIGGDKQVDYLNLPKEENPFLGVRGVRLTLENIALFESQISSILDSNIKEKVKIMFPMIATLEDFLEAKEVVVTVAKKIGAEVPIMGIMVETPSVAIAPEIFIEDVDFFSIGTNDLLQYSFAADRGITSLDKYHDALHPSFLKLLHNVIKTANENNIEVSVCGDMASDSDGAFILYLLGLRIFSLAPSQAPIIVSSLLKANDVIENLDIDEILSQKNSQSVRNFII